MPGVLVHGVARIRKCITTTKQGLAHDAYLLNVHVQHVFPWGAAQRRKHCMRVGFPCSKGGEVLCLHGEGGLLSLSGL